MWPFNQIYFRIGTEILCNFDKCRFPILNCSLLWISGFVRLILQGWRDSGGTKKSQIRSFIKFSICFGRRKIWDYNFCEVFHLFVSQNVAFVERRRHLQPANPFSRQPGCCCFRFMKTPVSVKTFCCKSPHWMRTKREKNDRRNSGGTLRQN